MVDPNTRTGKRTPVTLKIKFKSETLEQFIERYAVDVSQGGIFIRTKEPLAVGTQMKFEFQLRDASPLIGGEGTVVWTRENDPSRPAIAPGMGVRFDRLADGSQTVLERILSEKAKQAPQRSLKDTTKPPNMFTDTPTRVAPAPVQEALLGQQSGRPRHDSEQTPLPKPMPFLSDADEFPEEAFEEQTKVRSLDELVAQTALDGNTATKIMPADELAARRGNRADSTLADPPGSGPIASPQRVVDRDSAPGLPSPPEPSARIPSKLLDTSPSPRTEAPTNPPLTSGFVSESMAKTRLGLEPAKMPPRAASASVPPMTSPMPAPSPSIKDAPTRPSGMQAVAPRDLPSSASPAASAKLPTATRRGSNAPMVIGILFGVAVIGAAVWFLVIRDTASEEVSPVRGTGSAKPLNGGGSGGSDTVAAVGSGGSAGSALPAVGSDVAPVKPADLVDTTIGSSTEKATIEITDDKGTMVSGAAPFKTKLDKGRTYKARIKAAGMVTQEVEITGGKDPAPIKLVAKPHMVTIASDPPGALIFVDNEATGHSTPHDIELKGAKKSVHLTLRKSGFRPFDGNVDLAFTEDDATFVVKVDKKLVPAPVVVNTPRPPQPPHTGSNAGSATPPESGSATPPGPGSAEPDVKPPTPGSGSPPDSSLKDSGKGAGSAEPEPDWSKRN